MKNDVARQVGQVLVGQTTPPDQQERLQMEFAREQGKKESSGYRRERAGIAVACVRGRAAER